MFQAVAGVDSLNLSQVSEDEMKALEESLDHYRSLLRHYLETKDGSSKEATMVSDYILSHCS